MEIILGSAVSILVQIIKTYVGTTKWVTLAIVLVLSLISAAVYAFLTTTGMLDKIIPILLSAGGIYVFIIKRFEK